MMRISAAILLFFICLSGCEDPGIDPTPDPVTPPDTIIIPPDTIVPPPDTIIDPPDTTVLSSDPIALLGGTYSGNYIIKTLWYSISNQSLYTEIDTTYLSAELILRHCADTTKYTFNFPHSRSCCYDITAFESDSMVCRYQMGNIKEDFIVYPLSKSFKYYVRIIYPGAPRFDKVIQEERWLDVKKE